MDGMKLNVRGPGIGFFLQLCEDQRPRPLDQARRRQSLSETPAHDQSQSPLFKLPIEIRQAIYSEAGLASNTTIHCFTHTIKNLKHGAPRPGRIFGKLCTLSPNLEIPYSNPAVHPHCPPCWTKAQQALYCRPESFTDYDLEGTSPSITPLLQTCRRIYTEATPTLYATNTFSFTCTWTLTDFLSTVPTAHTSRIRHLSLTWTLYPSYPPHLRPGPHDNPHSLASWRALWARVGADMQGLRRLRLELCDGIRGRCRFDPYFEETDVWRMWRLEPLGLYAEAPQRLWLEWLGLVGEALEGREGEEGGGVEVEGGIWCKFGEEGSVHAVIKGGGDGGRRVLVLADGEEVEW